MPALLFALLVIGVYADPLFFRRNFAGRDLLGYMLPIEKSIHDAYSRGRLPVWISEISGGRPLMANPNTGALYPVRPLQSAIPFALAMRIFPVVHWILAGFGVILLIRSIGASRAGAWIGAVTYVFSAVSIGEVFFPNIQPGMTLLPWIVWAVARPQANPMRKLLVLSLLFALVLLAGDVFSIAIAIASCILWILLERARQERGRDLGRFSLALLLAGLLALPQILASLLWIPETNRAVLGMKLKESLFFSLSPFRLAELVVPFPFGPTWSLNGLAILGWRVFGNKPMGFFASLYAGALAGIGLFVMRKSQAPGARFARALFLAGLLLSVGPSLVPRRWGEFVSPLPLRYPEKFAVMLVLALAILAGLVFDRFRAAAHSCRWLVAVGAVLAGLAWAATLFPEAAGWSAIRLWGGAPGMAAAAGRQLAVALAEGGLLWMATVVAIDALGRPGKASLAVALLLLTAVPIAANRKIAPTFRQDEVFSPTPFARFVAKADASGSYRTLGESSYLSPSVVEAAISATEVDQQKAAARNWNRYTQALWNRGTVFNVDFDVGDLSRLESLRRISGFAATRRDSDRFFGSLALRFGIRYRDQSPLAGYRRIGGDRVQDWDEQPTALPDIRLVRLWRETPGGVPALNQIGRLEDGAIMVETGETRQGSARPGTIRILEKSPERLVVETLTPDPTWLFVLRGYWSHRRVLLDGLPADVLPAQLAFSAVSVPAGLHRIDWRELLPGAAVSRWGPVLFALLAALLLLRDLRSR